jgi:hypothetical protein
METEISGSMDQRGREKHQILPPVHDPQMPHQLHYEAGRPQGNNLFTRQEISHEFLDFYKDPLKTKGGPYLNNRVGDPKYPNYYHLGIE